MCVSPIATRRPLRLEGTMPAKIPFEVAVSPGKGKRRIRFAPQISKVVCNVPCVTEMSVEEKRSVYWLPHEFKGIRLAAKLVTKDIRKLGRPGVATIEEAFLTALRLCNLSDTDLDKLLQNPHEFTQQAEAWCLGDSNGRGLEKYVSATHRFKRSEYAKDARAAVLRMHRSEKINADQLSTFYIEYAKSATVYSRMLGHADYVAANPEDVDVVTPAPKKTLESLVQVPSRDLLSHHQRSPMVRQLSQRLETAICITGPSLSPLNLLE